MSESMADFEKEIDESLKTLNVVENEGESTEEETGFNAWDKVQQYLEDGTVLTLKVGGIVNKGVIVYAETGYSCPFPVQSGTEGSGPPSPAGQCRFQSARSGGDRCQQNTAAYWQTAR